MVGRPEDSCEYLVRNWIGEKVFPHVPALEDGPIDGGPLLVGKLSVTFCER